MTKLSKNKWNTRRNGCLSLVFRVHNFIFNAQLVDINLFSTTFLFAMKRTGHIVREKYLNTQQDYLPSLTFHKDVKLFTAGT